MCSGAVCASDHQGSARTSENAVKPKFAARAPPPTAQALYRMSSLRTHTLKQQISLPVACFFVFVQTASQFFQLPTCWGLNDGRARRSERLSGSPGTDPRLPTEDLLGHLGHALLGLHGLSLPTRAGSFIVTLRTRTPAWACSDRDRGTADGRLIPEGIRRK